MKVIRFFADRNCRETVVPMNTGHSPAKINLLELQLGLVDIGNGQAVWAGSIQKVYGGEKRYFKGWSGLVGNLREVLTPLRQLEVLNALLQIKEGDPVKESCNEQITHACPP